MNKKVLLYICLPVLLIGLTIGVVLFSQEDQEAERIAHDFEPRTRELPEGRESQVLIFTPESRVSLLSDLITQINELVGYREAFAYASSRESKLEYFREFDALFSGVHSERGRVKGIAAITLAVRETENIMYSWFFYDYYDVYTRIQLYADANVSVTQGQATELINELRSLRVLIDSEGVLTDSDKENITESINVLFSDIVSIVDRQPPLVSWTRKDTGEILIEGDSQFVQRIEEALDIIRRYPDYYELVTTYIDKIRPGRVHGDYSSYMDVIGIPADTVRSDVLVYGPTAGMGADHMRRSPMFIAGVIVHEAYHSKLFHEHKNYNTAPTERRWHTDADNYFYWPESDLWATGAGHMQVWEVHRDFLEEADAPSNEIEWAKRTMERVWARYPQLRGMELPRRFRIAPEVPLYRELFMWE
ncbi:MAG: type III secretion system effector protein [Oscillospiraceae bacterium]|nr:type III secretion system effector protein [Oscillospiraceae bacterium]MCL2278518.1 type III secretion system effector protein [Oscillospiraceae bacterium]